jgi:alkylation response protein AidB-like acyl-CoA dehydrogenase
MSDYQTPLRELSFVIDELCGVAKQFANTVQYNDLGLGEDLTASLIGEAAKLGENVLAPLRRSADLQGARWEDQKIILPDGFAEAIEQLGQGGWQGISASEQYGGQGLPEVFSTATFEIWNSANIAFSLGPMLTTAAALAIEQHGTESQKDTFLRKMFSGEWMGTMNLTESGAGSDLGSMKTQAVPEADHYRIYGQKIFITWGDHEATENIVHLVLGRLPNAAEGSRGISLFIVPKYLADEQGQWTIRNDVFPISNEHKLGIHGSPTCVMAFGSKEGAVGYLLGAENDGLRCMFTMMNEARLKVGVQSLGVAEAAYQKALSYACERVQGGRAIAEHPDVRRMLMTMNSLVQAMRAVSYVEAVTLDQAHSSTDENLRCFSQSRIDLMIPIIKAWLTELGIEIASLGIQVHGGMGYIEETGAAQYLRDIRITPIYEGTNGIQAADLLGRKLAGDDGVMMKGLLQALGETVVAANQYSSLAPIAAYLKASADDLDQSTRTLLSRFSDRADYAMLSSSDFLMQAGYVFGGWQLLRSALICIKQIQSGSSDSFYQTKISVVAFYMSHLLPRAKSHAMAISQADDAVFSVKLTNL